MHNKVSKTIGLLRKLRKILPRPPLIIRPHILQCSLYTNETLALLNDIQGVDNSILELSDSHFVEVLLRGRKFRYISSNTNILNFTMDFLLKTKRFDGRLF